MMTRNRRTQLELNYNILKCCNELKYRNHHNRNQIDDDLLISFAQTNECILTLQEAGLLEIDRYDKTIKTTLKGREFVQRFDFLTQQLNVESTETTAENESLNSNSVNTIVLGIDGDGSYSPDPIEIKAGQTITWYNGDSISHTVISGHDGDEDEASLFYSNAIIPNQHWGMTFGTPGKFDYYCIYHPSIVGEVRVN